MNPMRKILETIKSLAEAPSTSDAEILHHLNMIDLELDTITGRVQTLIRRSHNNPLPTNSPAAQERSDAKAPVLDQLNTITHLLNQL